MLDKLQVVVLDHDTCILSLPLDLVWTAGSTSPALGLGRERKVRRQRGLGTAGILKESLQPNVYLSMLTSLPGVLRGRSAFSHFPLPRIKSLSAVSAIGGDKVRDAEGLERERTQETEGYFFSSHSHN